MYTVKKVNAKTLNYCTKIVVIRGWEHNCTTKGCAILREAEKVLRAMHRDLTALGDCATCRHDKAVGYDEAPCICCMRGEKWEWKGPKT